MRFRIAHMSAAVCDIEFLTVTAWVQAVGATSGRNEARLLKSLNVNEKHAIGFHIGHEEKLSVRRDADVLRHAVSCRGSSSAFSRELEVTRHFALHQIDLR